MLLCSIDFCCMPAFSSEICLFLLLCCTPALLHIPGNLHCRRSAEHDWVSCTSNESCKVVHASVLIESIDRVDRYLHMNVDIWFGIWWQTWPEGTFKRIISMSPTFLIKYNNTNSRCCFLKQVLYIKTTQQCQYDNMISEYNFIFEYKGERRSWKHASLSATKRWQGKKLTIQYKRLFPPPICDKKDCNILMIHLWEKLILWCLTSMDSPVWLLDGNSTKTEMVCNWWDTTRILLEPVIKSNCVRMQLIRTR